MEKMVVHININYKLTNLKLYLIAGNSGDEVMKHISCLIGFYWIGFPYEKVLSLGKEQLPSQVALSGPTIDQN